MLSKILAKMTAENNSSKLSDYDVIIRETLGLLEWPKLCEIISNFTSTKQGEIHCKSLLPSDKLSTGLHLISETIEIGELEEAIEGGISFNGVFDISESLKVCKKQGVISGEELINIASTLGAARRLRKLIYDIETRPAFTRLLSNFSTLPDLEKILKFGIEEGGYVSDRASPRLAELRKRLLLLKSNKRDSLQELLRRFSPAFQDTTIGDRAGRSVLSLKKGYIGKIKGLVHDRSSSGNTFFIEPQEIISLENNITSVSSEVREEEFRLLKKWSYLVGDNFFEISHLNHTILKIDLALTRYRYSKWLKAVPPILKEDSDSAFSIEGLCHPLLLSMQLLGKSHSVVPISIEVPSDKKVVAITGPNTGGKTVTLKSLGLAVLMSRSGLFIPCKTRPVLPWISHVFADIGDEQSIDQNLSTFSGHVVRIKNILNLLKDLSGASLVLLDEVGAGTDPAEGTVLATSLLKILADRVRLTFATTHFGELKSLKYTDTRFENASVAFDSETLKPTFHLQWGIPGRSNALVIARRLGLDSEVLDTAYKLSGPESIEDINEIILGLERQRNRQQLAAEAAANLLAKTELLHEELLNRWEEQTKYSAKEEAKKRKQLEKSILEGQKEVRILINRLRDKSADGETARSSGLRLKDLQRENTKKKVNYAFNEWQPQLGERVRLVALEKAGEIVDISEDGLNVTVLCGLFRAKVHLRDLESLDGRKANPKIQEPKIEIQSKKIPHSLSETKITRNTIDIRGLRVHEAESLVEEKMRNLSGPFWVVHGIGTGKLKKGLRNWLSSLSYVERFEDADKSEGGYGCTVVWLR